MLLSVPSLGLFPLVLCFLCLSIIALSFLPCTLGWGRYPQWPSPLPVGGDATRVISLSHGSAGQLGEEGGRLVAALATGAGNCRLPTQSREVVAAAAAQAEDEEML